MRGTTAGRRLVLLSIPFTAFGFLLALAPPVTQPLGPAAGTVRRLGWLLAGLGSAAIAFGGYLLWKGDEKIV